MTDKPDALLLAVERGLLPPLAPWDFTVGGSHSSGPGSTVECHNGFVLITVSAEWLDGQLHVEIAGSGGPGRPYTDLIDTSKLKAVHTSNVAKGATVDQLASTLSKIAVALADQAPDVLAGTEAGMRRLK